MSLVGDPWFTSHFLLSNVAHNWLSMPNDEICHLLLEGLTCCFACPAFLLVGMYRLHSHTFWSHFMWQWEAGGTSRDCIPFYTDSSLEYLLPQSESCAICFHGVGCSWTRMHQSSVSTLKGLHHELSGVSMLLSPKQRVTSFASSEMRGPVKRFLSYPLFHSRNILAFKKF